MIYKVLVIGTISIFLSIALKNYHEEFRPAVIIGTGIIIIAILFNEATDILNKLNEVIKSLGIPDMYISMLFKILAIAYLTEFSASVAKDAGEESIANKFELAGKIAMLSIALPLFISILQMICELLP